MATAQPVPDVSVVIVSWNTRNLLLRCVRSVQDERDRSGLSVETIVVDNASTDGSPDAVQRAFPEITLLEQSENLGFAVGNNLGIEHSRGKTLLILNPDTELQPGSLDSLWRALHASSHVGLVAPVLLNANGTFQSAGYRFPGLMQTMLDLYPIHPRLIGGRLNGRYDPGDGLTPFQIEHPLGACMLARRGVIESVGVFDPGYFIYSEEIDWCRRIADAGWTILCAPAARVIHYGGQSTGQTPDRMRRQLHQSRARYFRLHHPPSFHRALQTLMSIGITLRRARIPIPTDGHTADDLAEIQAIYQEPRT